MIGYRQFAVIREVEQLGGYVRSEPVGPKWLREIVGPERMRLFDDVTVVSLEKPNTNAVLSRISRFQGLKSLWLRGGQVSDAGLMHLSGMTSLESVNLANTNVSADGLSRYLPLTKLKILWLDDIQATAAVQQDLKNSTGLKLLVVEKPWASDAAFYDLYDLELRQLKLTLEISGIQSLNQSLADLSESTSDPATSNWPKLTIIRTGRGSEK
jgi:hypothetical protein